MPDPVSARVIEVIAKTRRIPIESVNLDKTFQELNIDSLDGMNIVFAIEEEFGVNVPDDTAASLRSVRDVADGIEALLEQKLLEQKLLEQKPLEEKPPAQQRLEQEEQAAAE